MVMCHEMSQMIPIVRLVTAMLSSSPGQKSDCVPSAVVAVSCERSDAGGTGSVGSATASECMIVARGEVAVGGRKRERTHSSATLTCATCRRKVDQEFH